jgi:hypothetical protein
VPWEQVAGAPAGVLSVAASWVGGRLDLYAVGADRSLWYVALITPA